ncbi:MAG: hypothetical protein H0U88_05660 [Chthoniobacterales bacterium]|nr:hypothetical protein [Chthoniobacterales bacterium]
MKSPVTGFIAMLSICVTTAAAQPNEETLIRDLYRRGLVGEKEAVEQCIAKLEAVLKSEAKNQVARVYLGSAYTLRSRDLGFGPKKLQVLKQGLALMDQAVAAAPDDPKVRLPRALTTASLPGVFGRGASTRKDFELLAAQAKRTPGNFDEGELQIVFYNAGLAAKAAGDKARAAAFLEEALRHPADTALSGKVSTELARLQ